MTGLRIGEILALRWGRIDFIEETLLVAETCYKGHFGSPKTRASRREVPLAPAVVHELKAHYSRSAESPSEGSRLRYASGRPTCGEQSQEKVIAFRVQESWSAAHRLGTRFATRTARCCTLKEHH